MFFVLPDRDILMKCARHFVKSKKAVAKNIRQNHEICSKTNYKYILDKHNSIQLEKNDIMCIDFYQPLLNSSKPST